MFKEKKIYSAIIIFYFFFFSTPNTDIIARYSLWRCGTTSTLPILKSSSKKMITVVSLKIDKFWLIKPQKIVD